MYPSGDYADNAQYWIGVVLLNKGDKKGAIQAFDQVARTYPKSEKIPDALYKIGDTLLAMNNKPKAKEYFDYVIQNYPNTSGANFALKKKIAAKL
jgi:tol-pal system protein YbgF